MITIIWKLNNFEIAGFGTMTIIHMTKKNYIFLYQLYMDEGWNLSHPSCFMTLWFSSNCKAGVGGSPSTLLHQRGRRVALYWFLPASVERLLFRIGIQHECMTTKASSLFLESPPSLLIREMLSEWTLKRGKVSERWPSSPVLSMWDDLWILHTLHKFAHSSTQKWVME